VSLLPPALLSFPYTCCRRFFSGRYEVTLAALFFSLLANPSLTDWRSSAMYVVDFLFSLRPAPPPLNPVEYLYAPPQTLPGVANSFYHIQSRPLLPAAHVRLNSPLFPRSLLHSKMSFFFIVSPSLSPPKYLFASSRMAVPLSRIIPLPLLITERPKI